MRYAKGFSFLQEGVALTSTSANHIANMAKEYIQGTEIQLNNVSFLNVEVGLISANAHNVIQEGTSREVLSSIPLKERNRYYQLETVAAVIGKYIHPNDVLSDERKKLKDRRLFLLWMGWQVLAFDIVIVIVSIYCV